MNLSTNSDKSYLRVRLRNRDGDDNENDGSKSNLPPDIKLKVRHISRVGSEMEKTGSEHERGNELSADKSTSYFVIKLKTSVGDWSTFKFVAESLAERDTVVLAIRSLIDQVKTLEAPRKSSRGERKDDSASGDLNEASVQQPKDTNEVAFFDFDTENVKPTSGTNLTQPFHDGRDGSERRSVQSSENNKHNSDGTDRAGVISDVEGQATVYNTTGSLVESHWSSTANYSVEKSATSRSDIKTKTQLEVSNSDLAERQMTDGKPRQESSLAYVSSQPGTDIKRKGRPRKHNEALSEEVGVDKSIAIERVKASLLYEAMSCSTMGCQSQALAVVEDGDLATMAANQMTGPWCTDDICTASLKDFADSMRGIFEVKQESNEGIYAASAKQRPMAEEYISGFLADNSMSEFLSVKDIWNAAAMQHATPMKPKTISLQNRARSVDGSAIRMKNLKTQMTFNGADTKTKCFVQTVHSFDDVNRTGKWDRQRDSPALRIGGQFDSSAYLDKDVNEVQEADGSENLYYDSDPEVSRERTLKRGPRRAMAERESTLAEETKTKPREALDIIDSSRLGLGRKWKRLDEDLVQDIIEVCNGTRKSRTNIISCL